jgi:hypothetical protein
MDWLQTAVGLGTGIVVATITSVLTVRLALRRFYAEKWWERKSTAYTAIIEAMHHVREQADSSFEAERRHVEIPPETEEILRRKMKEGLAQLRLHRDIGSLVVSDEATALLNKLLENLEASADEQSWIEYLVARMNAVTECMPQMRRIAKIDLRIDGLPR